MELKVWVEGIQRIVCGVTEKTTCQDVVYALAHATGKTGRFTLIERWRNNERLLAPHEHPLKVLMKWGEYSSDVHFILQRTAIEVAKGSIAANNNVNKSLTRSKPIDPLHGFTPPVSGSDVGRPSANSKDLKKSLTFSGGHHLDPSQSKESTPFSERKVTVGIVRGIPQQLPHQETSQNGGSSLNSSFDHQEKGCINFPHGSELFTSRPCGEGSYPLVYPQYEPSYSRLNRPVNANGGDSYSHLPIQYSAPPPPPPPLPLSSVQSTELNIRYPHYEQTRSSLSPGEEPTRAPPPYRNPPPPAAVIGIRHAVPPPYREPPRPRGPSPYRASPGPSSNSSPLPVALATIANASPNRIDTRPSMSPGRSETVPDNPIRVCFETTQLRQANPSPDATDFVPVRNKSKRNQANEFSTQPPSPPSDPHHAHIIQLVNRQREKLDEQQQQLLQLEKDLNLWDVTLSQRQEEETRMIRQEFMRLEEKHDENEEELAVLLQLEAQWETLRKEEEDITNELSQFNSNISNVNAQIDRYSNAAKTLKGNIQSEEERYLVSLEEELARVKAHLEEANEKERLLSSEQEELAKNVLESDETVRQLKEQIEQLTQEIKEANLQSLSIAPADDLKLLLEGSYKSGHSRRMLGSPRQLENAVPTNKNPHGVWV